MDKTVPRSWLATVAACGVLLTACATPDTEPERPKMDAVPGQIARLLPSTVADRAGWAADIYAAFSTLGIAPSTSNLCAALAITEQESTFQADPRVPGLADIAWREIGTRAERAGIAAFAVRAALQMESRDGRTFAARIDAVKTERELSEIFEDFIAMVPLGTHLFANLNPVKTGGPMQVSISFAEAHVETRAYPYPINGSIRREVFTRRGGMYFGIAHLLGYEAPYDEPLYRFADFNAGRYASRNAAFQRAVGQLAGKRLVLDGDLLPPGATRDSPPGETENAALTLSSRLGLSAAVIRRDLERGDEAEFERTRLYQRVFEHADRGEGRRVPRAVLPTITLKSPKFKRKLTTEWFARRVDQRYQRCLATASARQDAQ
jgi:hypothetical protein